MKREIRHIFCYILLVMTLGGCSSHEDVLVESGGNGARLTLNVAVPGADTKAANPVFESKELMRTLRVIIIGGDVIEYNKLLTFSSSVRQTAITDIVLQAGEKTVYLLGNEESLETEFSFEKTDDAASFNDLWEKAVIEETVLNKDFLPLTSKYTLSVSEEEAENGTKKDETFYVVCAATKFSFEYKNNTGEAIEMNSCTLYSVAERSYLFPHVEPETWKEWTDRLNQLESMENPDWWVTDYKVPGEESGAEIITGHKETVFSYENVRIEPGSSKSVPMEYRLESKYLIPMDESQEARTIEDEQGYTVVLKINGENARPVVLSNLKSLIRSTHVKVIVTINKLEEETELVVGSIDVEMIPWKWYDPVSGGLVPVDNQ